MLGWTEEIMIAASGVVKFEFELEDMVGAIGGGE